MMLVCKVTLTRMDQVIMKTTSSRTFFNFLLQDHVLSWDFRGFASNLKV
jgi:hypothetical protein